MLLDEPTSALDRTVQKQVVALLRNGTLKTYPGFSHGMLTLNHDVINPDLLAFVRG